VRGGYGDDARGDKLTDPPATLDAPDARRS
jgi:hypothetical protein